MHLPEITDPEFRSLVLVPELDAVCVPIQPNTPSGQNESQLFRVSHALSRPSQWASIIYFILCLAIYQP